MFIVTFFNLEMKYILENAAFSDILGRGIFLKKYLHSVVQYPFEIVRVERIYRECIIMLLFVFNTL